MHSWVCQLAIFRMLVCWKLQCLIDELWWRVTYVCRQHHRVVRLHVTPVVLLYNFEPRWPSHLSKLEMHASNGVYSGTFQNNASVILNSDSSLFIPRSIPITLLYILLQDLHSAFVEKVSTGELKQKCYFLVWPNVCISCTCWNERELENKL